MKIEIIVVGKNKFSYLDEGIADYEKKLKRDVQLDFLFIKESPITHGDRQKILHEEGERILKSLKEGYYKIALDVLGRQLSSEELSVKIGQVKDFEGAKIQFVIGGALGLSPDVLDAVDLKLSFSKLTFTHQMIRLMLVEQIYRSFEIIRRSGYHK